jgi:hypothetical protein
MSRREQQTPAGPPRWAKRVISLLIALHFMAILSVVTSASSGNYPAPPLAIWFNAPFRPYTQFTFLTNPYRFYAPEPGPTNLLWFRVVYEDKTARWVEVPDRDAHSMRMPYQRHLSVAMLVDQMAPQITNDTRLLYPVGQICITSYVRHVARTQERTRPDGTRIAVSSVELYFAPHRQLWPDEFRLGMEFNDIRTYALYHAGSYTPDGSRIDPFGQDNPGLLRWERTSGFVATLLTADVYPIVQHLDPAARASVVDQLEIPKPIRHLLAKAPELLELRPSPPTLEARIREAVESRDEPVMKKRMESEGRYLTEW